MNEPRFIELLNLYVDQQLSPTEAAELEVEIQQNPARRRTYQQYCRMQKGCALLFEHERTTAPASTALARAMADADRKIVAFPEDSSRRSFWSTSYSVAAVAAAACVAAIVALRTPVAAPALPSPDVAAVNAVAAPVSVAAVPAVVAEHGQPAATLTGSDEFIPVFTMQPLRAAASKPDGLFVSVSKEDAQLLEWTHQVQLKPLRKISAEEFAFNVRAKEEKPVTMQFSAAPEEESTVIQFTR